MEAHSAVDIALAVVAAGSAVSAVWANRKKPAAPEPAPQLQTAQAALSEPEPEPEEPAPDLRELVKQKWREQKIYEGQHVAGGGMVQSPDLSRRGVWRRVKEQLPDADDKEVRAMVRDEETP